MSVECRHDVRPSAQLCTHNTYLFWILHESLLLRPSDVTDPSITIRSSERYTVNITGQKQSKTDIFWTRNCSDFLKFEGLVNVVVVVLCDIFEGAPIKNIRTDGGFSRDGRQLRTQYFYALCSLYVQMLWCDREMIGLALYLTKDLIVQFSVPIKSTTIATEYRWLHFYILAGIGSCRASDSAY